MTKNNIISCVHIEYVCLCLGFRFYWHVEDVERKVPKAQCLMNPKRRERVYQHWSTKPAPLRLSDWKYRCVCVLWNTITVVSVSKLTPVCVFACVVVCRSLMYLVNWRRCSCTGFSFPRLCVTVKQRPVPPVMMTAGMVWPKHGMILLFILSAGRWSETVLWFLTTSDPVLHPLEIIKTMLFSYLIQSDYVTIVSYKSVGWVHVQILYCAIIRNGSVTVKTVHQRHGENP